jgi:hypothetical protein
MSGAIPLLPYMPTERGEKQRVFYLCKEVFVNNNGHLSMLREIGVKCLDITALSDADNI